MNAFAPNFISPRPEPAIDGGSFHEAGGRFHVRLVSSGCVEQAFALGFEFSGQRRAAPFHRSAGRITSPFQLTALGCHVFRLRESRASDAPAPGFPAGYLRPCSQLNGKLYGPKNGILKKGFRTN